MRAYLGLCVVALALCACAGTPDEVIGIDGARVSALEVEGTTVHRIHVATTRQPADDPALMFTGKRSRELHFAQIDVSIPPAHRTGRVERPKSVPPDPRTEFVALEPVMHGGDQDFVAALTADLASRPPAERNVLVFIHGYNTTFSGALYRFAQFVHDSGYKGVPLLFTWPSGGATVDYLYDINSALASRDEVLRTLLLVDRTPAARGDLVAHSMGNFLAIEAIRQAALMGLADKRQERKLRHVILASPDIDIDLFAKQLRAMPKNRGDVDVHILISRDDKALLLAKRLAGGVERVGRDGEAAAKLGLTVIDLTEVDDTNSLNHTKFANSPDIVQLIGGHLREGDTLSTAEEGSTTARIAGATLGTVTAIPRALTK